ncbi:MAG: GCN5-related N-acetyltransferase [Frankiales bacterium]|nr:GCN5-related N-acetyltransferase [Frankiales bacterium]
MKDVLPSRSSSAPDAPPLACRRVEGPDELVTHHDIRRAVFVVEQGLFAIDDRDGHDDDPATVHVLGFVRGVPAGTVRLHPIDGPLWKGDRLAVLPEFRRSGIGGPLVRHAVAAAARCGGTRMNAQVQAVNVRFFLALGWAAVGEPADHLGVPHQQMTIALG